MQPSLQARRYSKNNMRLLGERDHKKEFKNVYNHQFLFLPSHRDVMCSSIMTYLKATLSDNILCLNLLVIQDIKPSWITKTNLCICVHSFLLVPHRNSDLNDFALICLLVSRWADGLLLSCCGFILFSSHLCSWNWLHAHVHLSVMLSNDFR